MRSTKRQKELICTNVIYLYFFRKSQTLLGMDDSVVLLDVPSATPTPHRMLTRGRSASVTKTTTKTGPKITTKRLIKLTNLKK